MLKNGRTQRKIQYWGIPPEANGEFVAGRENVRETSAQPYDPRLPVGCMDEHPGQLLKETRVPIAAPTTHARRGDYEDERAGRASVFMFTEPLQGWRQGRVRAHRTKVDWAGARGGLLRTRCAEAEKVSLVCDHLNTHTRGAFYEACAAKRARELGRRLEVRSTPKHGSWRNSAENERRVLTRQGLNDRRFGDTQQLAEETAAWSTASNQQQRAVDWQFTINDARIKLKSLYPKIKD